MFVEPYPLSCEPGFQHIGLNKLSTVKTLLYEKFPYLKSPIEARAVLRTCPKWKFHPNNNKPENQRVCAGGQQKSTNLNAPYCSALLISFDSWPVNLDNSIGQQFFMTIKVFTLQGHHDFVQLWEYVWLVRILLRILMTLWEFLFVRILTTLLEEYLWGYWWLF